MRSSIGAMRRLMVATVTLILVAAACGDGGSTATVDVGEGADAGDPVREARAGLYADSTWPGPGADIWRTSAVSGDVGLPTDVTADALVATSAELGPAPLFAVSYGDDEVFVSGGTPFLLDMLSDAQAGDPADKSLQTYIGAVRNVSSDASVNPYIAKVNVNTMEVETLELEKGTTINYVGGLIAHENGNLYAVATSTLFEIDPESFEVTGSLDLPKLETDPIFTTYNGIQVAPTNGDLILKMSDFSGLTDGGVIVAVDPTDLTIRFQTTADTGAARMTMAVQGDTEYMYIPGPTQTTRYAITPDGFELDEQWSKTYRSDNDGSTQAVAFVYTGSTYDMVVFNSNNSIVYGVTAPLQIYTQSTTDTSADVKTVTAVDTDQPGGNFFNVAGDPFHSGMFVALDAVNGIMAGWSLGEDGVLSKVWETSDYTVAAGPAIAVDRGHLYTDTRECDASGNNCTFYLVVLDLMTGEEIARTTVEATIPTIGRIFVGPDSVFYIASEVGKPNGIITRVTTK